MPSGKRSALAFVCLGRCENIRANLQHPHIYAGAKPELFMECDRALLVGIGLQEGPGPLPVRVCARGRNPTSLIDIEMRMLDAHVARC